MEKKKILIIDDEQTNILILKSMLSNEEYDIKIAHDGQEGLELAKKEMPELILLDVMMPKLDGFKVCGLLKSDRRFSQMSVIILSSRAGNDDVEISKKVRADAYLLKPIKKEELLKEIDRVLGK